MLNKEKINNLEKLKSDYKNGKAFPHIVLNELWDDRILNAARLEVESFQKWDGEKDFYGSQKKRWQSNWEHLPTTVKNIFHFLNSPEFLKVLEQITGETGLIPDPYLNGGGIHSTGKGGFLKLHADFNWHSQLKLYRRLNVLIYLNKNWKKKYKGQLELASKKNNEEFDIAVSVNPDFNKTVIFTTDDHSFHGHTDPLQTPELTRRNSLAVYYYVSEKPKGTSHKKRLGTDYRYISGQKMRYPFLKRVKKKIDTILNR